MQIFEIILKKNIIYLYLKLFLYIIYIITNIKMDYSYTDGGDAGVGALGRIQNASKGVQNAAASAFNSLKKTNAKYSDISTFKMDVDALKEKKSTMFLNGTLYLLKTNALMLVVMVIVLMLVFSLIYAKFNLTGNNGYLTDPAAVISLVTTMVLLTCVVTTMFLGRRAVLKTLEAEGKAQEVIKTEAPSA
jgi:hypothetical protein